MLYGWQIKEVFKVQALEAPEYLKGIDKISSQPPALQGGKFHFPESVSIQPVTMGIVMFIPV